MNTKTKLLLTAVMVTAALTFSPHAVKAESMEGGHGMMMDEKDHGASETAIHGYCPVCVINGMKVKGKDHFTTEYKGKVYKFAGIDQQKMFLEDPEKYVADLDTKFDTLKDESMMKKDGGMVEGSH